MGVLFEREIDAINDHTDWTAYSNDTLNKADSTTRIRGTGAVTFDKANGAANKTCAGIYRTASSLNLESGIDPWNELCWYSYASDLTDIAYNFVRLGVDADNYIEYRYDDSLLTAGVWAFCHIPLYAFQASAGTGCPLSDIDYIMVGVEFDAEDKALAGLIVNWLSVQPVAIYTA